MVRVPVNTVSPGKSRGLGFSYKMRSAYFIIALPRHRGPDAVDAVVAKERRASVRTRISRAREKLRSPWTASPLSGIAHEENKCSAIKDLCALPPTCNDLPRQVRCGSHYPRPATRILTAEKCRIHRARARTARDDETRYASR